MGRIAGDTAIVVILLGATLQLQAEGDAARSSSMLQGTGSTLTSYVYNNSPAGEGNAPEKAYAAAFVLLLIVIALNFVVDLIAPRQERRSAWSPSDPAADPPHRRRREPADGRAAPRRAIRRPTGTRSAPRLRRRARRPRRAPPPASSACARGPDRRLRRPRPRSSDVTLPVRQGEVLALIGPSGCGKTTLLRSLNRLTELTPTARRTGAILLDGEDIDELEVTELRRRVSMVFQQPNPFPMSVFDNVAYALREQGAQAARARPSSSPPVEDALRARRPVGRGQGRPRATRRCGSRAASSSACASRRALAVAARGAAARRAVLGARPALDGDHRGADRASCAREVAIVIVTHNLQQAYRVADHVAFMYLGDLVEYGPAEQVFGAPRAQRTRDYVGGAFG